MKTIILVLLVSVTFISSGQFIDKMTNPTVSVNINHPPCLGLKIDKVSFNEPKGEFSDQIMDAVISDFVNNKVEVIDRQDLDVILKEHNLSASGYIDKSKAVSMGGILGPTALITIKTLRCETQKNPNLVENVKLRNKTTGAYYYQKRYIAKTQFHFNVSVKVTDLTSGKIFAAQTYKYSPFKENKSYNGTPVLPSAYEVQESAFRSFSYDVHKLFFNWNERISLVYYNDRKGGLKEAFGALENSNNKLCYDLSILNAKNAVTNGESDRLKAHAIYNKGIAHFIFNEYDLALAEFKKAQSIKNTDIIQTAINRCNKAKLLVSMADDIENKSSVKRENIAKEVRKKENNILTNESIISLTKKGLPEALIIQKIKTSQCNFDVSTDGLLNLVEKNVNETVIALMMEK